MQAGVRRAHVATLIETSMMALRIAAPTVLLLLGAALVLEGRMSLGSMLALNALAASFLGPLSTLVSSAQSMQVVGAHLDRIADVLDAAPEQDPTRVRPIAPHQRIGRLEMRHVSFRYQPSAPLALNDVSLSIEPGQKIGIVGRTGSGKSTLGKLLLGLYPPTEGVVSCDGVPLGDLDVHALRGRFGVVLQESFLFSGSIRGNIALLDPTLSLEDTMHAARLAAMHDEIERLPMGYETILSEGGTGLSGGQRQRLSIARALAVRPEVLLLDEATSHLDVLTEESVDANLASLECTRIVIAHRLSTIRGADCILVMEDGRIVERGTHEALVKHGGIYADLVREQTQGLGALQA
jgi:ABC-type bacteriocin/lantibiotic exporter with double-glycine peptidase domain